jgi:hypothetical protein
MLVRMDLLPADYLRFLPSLRAIAVAVALTSACECPFPAQRIRGVMPRSIGHFCLASFWLCPHLRWRKRVVNL